MNGETTNDNILRKSPTKGIRKNDFNSRNDCKENDNDWKNDIEETWW